MTATVLAAAAFGFAIGSVPTGYLVGRIAGRRDVRRSGSGSIGATNVLRVLGAAPAAVTLALDVAKGLAAALAARALWPGRETASAVAGVGAVLGHVFTPWLGFRGGKGAATAAGMLAPLGPVAVLLALAVFGVVLAFSRRVSAGSLAGAASFPAWATLVGARPPVLAAGISAAVILFWSHRDNLARLAAGTEPRVGDGTRGDGRSGT